MATSLHQKFIGRNPKRRDPARRWDLREKREAKRLKREGDALADKLPELIKELSPAAQKFFKLYGKEPTAWELFQYKKNSEMVPLRRGTKGARLKK